MRDRSLAAACQARYNSSSFPVATMKARVYVTLKKTVLDPQGQTIHRALAHLGYQSVKQVRQGKVFELELDGLAPAQARAELERLARDVLVNPVIEEFRYELEE